MSHTRHYTTRKNNKERPSVAHLNLLHGPILDNLANVSLDLATFEIHLVSVIKKMEPVEISTNFVSKQELLSFEDSRIYLMNLDESAISRLLWLWLSFIQLL